MRTTHRQGEGEKTMGEELKAKGPLLLFKECQNLSETLGKENNQYNPLTLPQGVPIDVSRSAIENDAPVLGKLLISDLRKDHSSQKSPIEAMITVTKKGKKRF